MQKLLAIKLFLILLKINSFQAHVGFVNKLRLKSSVLLFKYCRYFADAMIGISEHLYNLIRTTTEDKIPSYLIPVTVNLNYFKTPGEEINTPEKTVKIFYGGSFGGKDGLDYLINAFDEVSLVHENTELIFTGMGHKLDMDRVFAQIDKVKT
ncbi:MAG: glycosyltransferase family 4 protein [Bacteroidia bacterium]|nr:glycosyltransferase family 4 protein [Bacteroidia bacterium]